MSDSISAPGGYPYNQRYVGIVQHNPQTNEPFISLPAPYSNIRLTPPRLSDGDEILAIMNNPDVIMNFAGPPYPYLREHCDGWLQDRVREYESALVRLKNISGDVGFLDSSPLRHIREVASDGAETFIGEVSLTREDVFCEIRDEEARTAKANMNINLPPGDSGIVWTFGDYLRPTHHRRGIMTAAVKAVIELWAIPHMNAYKFWAATFPENTGSQKVFLKNGFQIVDRVVGAVQFPESKGGHTKDSMILHRNTPIPNWALHSHLRIPLLIRDAVFLPLLTYYLLRATNKPFIVLATPHSNIRLTPACLSDVKNIPSILNKFDVATGLRSQPFPYLREHCEIYVRGRVCDYENARVYIRNVDGDVGYIDPFPPRHIREVRPDGTEAFLGEVGLNREEVFEDIDGTTAEEAMIAENASLPPGGPAIVWSFAGK